MQLKDAKEELTAIYLEGKVRALNTKLKEENSLPMSLDSLIQEANTHRAKRIEEVKNSIYRTSTRQ